MAVPEVRGMNAAMQAAEAGMKLFAMEQQDAKVEYDEAAASQYKMDVELRIAALEEEASKLSGKDNKKERAAKGKEVSELKGDAKYVDACKIMKGSEPRHGHFVKTPAISPDAKKAPKPAAGKLIEAPEPTATAAVKKESKAKKQESAGLSPAETKELEQLKNDIVARKNELKEQGLSGGQQNKDPQVVAWVNRMNELKEKQDPGSTSKDAKKKDAKKGSRAPLSSEEQKELDQLRGSIEVYKHKLKTEFGYSNKDMKEDPDLVEMEKKLAAFEKRE